MNKNIIFIGAAVVIGLLLGYFIFNDSDKNSGNVKDVSDRSESHNHEDESAEQMWTCSMHPQIMRSEPGDCPICGMDLIPAESMANGLTAEQFRMTDNAIALANIQTTIVGEASLENGGTVLTGTIMANKEANSVQASYFDGRIERLNINYEGQELRKGQLLATIYAPNLVAAQQELLTASSLKETQPDLYKAVRNKLKLWKLSENQINKIEESKKVVQNFSVYATVFGTVAEVMTAEGDYVKQGQPLLKVSNLNTVWAEFDAYENQVSQFKKGQKISVTTNAYPNKEFNATVSFIDPVLNSRTRTVTVRATLNNTENIFKPGMFVSGKIEGAANTKAEQQLIVPASAVMWTGERSLIYVKTNPSEPVFEMREVTIGSRNGENYTILNGVTHGEEIVTNGTFTVDAAAQLQGKKSMMNSSGLSNNKITPKQLPESFTNDFNAFLEIYMNLKDAFVKSDSRKVIALAKSASTQLKNAKTFGVSKGVQTQIDQIVDQLDAISASSKLETQRDHFVPLNENIVGIVLKMPLVKNIYIQKCPMANNNKGAMWLSNEKLVKNPYYGEQMLTCGSVIDSIAAQSL